MTGIRVLVVDDAVVMRRLIGDVLAAEPDIEVVTAANGRIGLAKLVQTSPDAVVLDIEMPELDGLGALRELRKTHPKLPVIMFSTLTERGASATLEAMSLGASDYVTKPANVGSVNESMARVRAELIPKIRALCDAVAPTAPSAAMPAPGSAPAPPAPTVSLQPIVARRPPVDVVAIGTSTGGPRALQEVLGALPASLDVPVVVVQHMPPVFTRLLAERLDATSGLRVREAAGGEVLEPGTVWIAPGEHHLVLRRSGDRVVTALDDGPAENSCRPAVDVLFRSVAATYADRALAVVLTGMGADGQRGAEHLVAAGSEVIVQDEASSVVWGMPGAVARAGLASAVVGLSEVGPGIDARVRGRGRAGLAVAVS
jgi:two-component system chemotaxis response regulator CheB